MKKNGIKLVPFFTPDLPRVYADPAQLTQVLVNLVVNSVQAMPQGGALSIRTGCSEHMVSLVVEDTGTGMTGEVMEQIFNPFFTTKDIDQGTGLGLSVVHGIVTAHKGTIEARSDPGKGSVFEIKLPAGEKVSNMF